MKDRIRAVFLFLAVTLLASGCSTNPVTGESELRLISDAEEIAMGTERYVPVRQLSGGDYVADPEVQRYVEDVGRRLAAVSDRPLPYEFRVVNDSTPNAWALPGGKIAVNRGLLVEMDSEAELAAVLAHEVVHSAAGHSADSIQREKLMETLILLGSLALDNSRHHDSAIGAARVGADLLVLKYSRDDEREADYHGMRYMALAGYDPNEAVRLQETMLRLADGRDPTWLSGLFASHPPSQERVNGNTLTVQELSNPGGEIGRERYRQKMARLMRTRPAYDAYDQAIEAWIDERDEDALRLLEDALTIEPDESLFYGLQADILAGRGESEEALALVDRALALNPDNYSQLLTRATLLDERGDTTGAQRDLYRSYWLLPTTEASFELGLVALEQGHRDEAIDYFRAAWVEDSPTGEAAGVQLAKLDLSDNPDHYLDAWVTLEPDGFLRVTVENTVPVAVSDVCVIVGAERLLGYEIRERGRYTLDAPLGPGEQRSVKTDIGPFSKDKASNYAARVISATIVESSNGDMLN